MALKLKDRRVPIAVTVFCLGGLISACAPRPTDGRSSMGEELKLGEVRGLAMHKAPDRKKLSYDLAQAVQVCLLDRNPLFSGFRLEGPRRVASNVWQITLVDLQERNRQKPDVVVTIGNPPLREGIFKLIPKEVSLGKAAVTVKRLGDAARARSVLALAKDSLTGSAPCDGVQGTGVALIPKIEPVAAPTALSTLPSYPLPIFYPQFYR